MGCPMTELSVAALFLAPLLAGMVLVFFRPKQHALNLLSVVAGGLQLLASVVSVASISWTDPSKSLNGETLHFLWSAIWSVDFVLGVSSFSGPFLLLSSFIFFLVYICLAGVSLARERLLALFFLQAAVNASYLSGSLLSFVFFSSMTILPTALLLGLDQNLRSSWSIHKFLCGQAIATVLASVTLIALQSNSTHALADWFVLVSGQYQVESRMLLFWLLCISLLIRSACYPFYLLQMDWSRAKPFAAFLPIITVAGVGLYGFFRFTILLFPSEWLQSSLVFAVIGILSILWASLRLANTRSHRTNIFYLSTLFQGLVVLGLATGQKYGVLGAWTLLIFSHLSLAAYGVLLVFAETRDEELKPGYTAQNSYAGFSYVLCLLAAFGFPVSIGFYSIAFIFWGSAMEFSAVFFTSLLCLPLLLYAAVRNLVPMSKSDRVAPKVWSRFELGLYAPILFLLLISGLLPNYIIATVVPTVEYFIKLLGRG